MRLNNKGKAGLPAFLLHQWVLKGILARYRAFAYKQSDRSVNDQRTIDCFNPSGSAVRYQAYRATLSCGARLELAGQSDDFILRQRTMRLESVLKKTVKIGQVLAPGTVA